MLTLFLIRHGETVDNVARVYAGRKDSQLTNHGIEQANRLGRYLNAEGVALTHIFSSTLQRAFKTAELVRAAQACSGLPNADQSQPEVVRLPVLVERDFGFYEGRAFHTRSRDANKSGNQAYHGAHRADPGVEDEESKESMAERMDNFLDEHLLPVFNTDISGSESVIAIVSHGIILSVLWRRLLLRLPRNSAKLDPELLAKQRTVALEHLGGWSNTGYLLVHFSKTVARATPASVEEAVEEHITIPIPLLPTSGVSICNAPYNPTAIRKPDSQTKDSQSADGMVSKTQMAKPVTLAGWSATIKTVNGKEHLIGFKRARGGLGSVQHDESQTTITSFFKKRKFDSIGGNKESTRIKSHTPFRSDNG
ncbi:hypothetical protein W97_03956 [Coniosporium apollinis CBS 100218]|uniref:Phosphoglycerate mutase n=1 Tax=Coniosporium apollinis (strain CBS 100218) TaxID=1168221 RepID=R7YSB1_CONA1|nr:uncharacterized protein W97_03956 [Coniosporium apollinis CBS 100218]EON64723.1 hypothetical protein W97_03956 [Coniosporium apollinis CBS 100218]